MTVGDTQRSGVPRWFIRIKLSAPTSTPSEASSALRRALGVFGLFLGALRAQGQRPAPSSSRCRRRRSFRPTFRDGRAQGLQGRAGASAPRSPARLEGGADTPPRLLQRAGRRAVPFSPPSPRNKGSRGAGRGGPPGALEFESRAPLPLEARSGPVARPARCCFLHVS